MYHVVFVTISIHFDIVSANVWHSPDLKNIHSYGMYVYRYISWFAHVHLLIEIIFLHQIANLKRKIVNLVKLTTSVIWPASYLVDRILVVTADALSVYDIFGTYVGHPLCWPFFSYIHHHEWSTYTASCYYEHVTSMLKNVVSFLLQHKFTIFLDL